MTLLEDFEGDQAVGGYQHRIVFPPAVVVVLPEAVNFLQADEFVHQLVSPIVRT